jgi:uncharacterized protein YjbI with pentapeptide repeats
MGHLTPSTQILAAVLTFSVLASAQSPSSAHKASSSKEEQTSESQRSKDEAEAEYYRELTKKLREPSPSPTPVKTFQQTIAENPASALGIIAALLAAFVGLLTLYVNNRAALRAQRDSQFYEALKRFGDRDSPTVRSSAAGILAQIGKRKVGKMGAVKNLLRDLIDYKWLVGSSWENPKWGRKYPYYDTVFDQLATGLLLEDNLVSLESIRNAVQELIAINPYKTIDVLRIANLNLQDDVVNALAEFWGAKEANTLEGITESLWNHAESIARYDLKSTSQIFDTFTAEQKKEYLISARRKLEVAAARLRTNTKLYAYTLREFSLKRISFGFNHNGVFLAEADLRNISLEAGNLRNAQLHGANLSDAQLQRANLSNAVMVKTKLLRANLKQAVITGAQLQMAELWWAQLQGANLSGVKMQGASLISAGMEGANLSSIQIDENTKMEDTNWWQAEFGSPEEEPLRIPHAETINLLEMLYDRYGEAIPDDVSKVSSSIETFITSKRKGTDRTKSE